MSKLNAVVVELARVFERAHISYMVIGGMAAQVWANPRFTADIDIAVGVDPRDPAKLFEVLKPLVKAMRPDAAELVRDTGILRFTHKKDVSVDLGVSETPYLLNALDRAVDVEVDGQTVKFCTPEDLILHKLLADRTQDRDDIKAVIRRQGKKLDRAYLDPLVEQIAEATYRPEILERYRSLLSVTRS
ncbi:MAG TPA: nucleotidyl transferase AbiEii/AbiGii toxin family protein [Thermoanaerobaculia bacterium]